jgi:hypothetical protein
MRASSLSNAKVIDLLNSCFVAVNVSNEAYGEGGSAPAEEKAEKNRIYREALAAGLPAGTVCAYLLTSDARPVDVAPLNQSLATDPGRLADKMEGLAKQVKAVRGGPVVEPAGQSTPPTCDADSLVLHLTARYLERKGNDLVRLDTDSVLGSRKGGNWADLPSEDWIVLGRAEWTKLLPAGQVRPGLSWELDKKAASKLLGHVFPPTENTNFEKNRIDEHSLRAQVESIQDGVARARLEGNLRMKHPFYHQDDNNHVDADLIGYLDFEPGEPRIRSFRLVTDRATYGGDASARQFFGVAVRSVPGGK